MEGSKTFSKDFMKKHSIPTAAYENFTDAAAAKAFIKAANFDVVLKASGLAAGKGVLIPTTKEEAYQGVDQILVDKVFGSAGRSNFLISIFFWLPAKRYVPKKGKRGRPQDGFSFVQKCGDFGLFFVLGCSLSKTQSLLFVVWH